MKLLSNKIFMILIVTLSVLGYIVSCTHKDVVPPAPASNVVVITHGTDVLLPGDMTKGDTTEWKLDQVHSSVLWSTSYLGAAGLLTGRFNWFGISNVTPAQQTLYSVTGQPLLDSSWAFYENDPSKTYFNGYVQINTSNTGEPGRDTGCNISALGTVKIIPGQQNLMVNNLAQIQTTKVEFDPNSTDYIVTFNLTWQGLLTAPKTESLVGKLKYIKKNSVTIGTSTYSVFGLQLSFAFNCRDFGVASTSIGDNIDIQVNVNFNNK
ncbi:MAG TPA: YceI family protein [Chitinophagaceae bacterium]|nr:YceI family protein [Chitinophagaceae bacterium]